MPEAITKTQRKIKTNISAPPKFKVVVYNDDHTSMEFVIAMLTGIFKYQADAAAKIMVTIHTSGLATVGVYPYEIAEQKTIEATHMARTEGYPLIIKVEQE